MVLELGLRMKTFIWGGMAIGSTLGGFIPLLWNSSVFSFSSIILTAVGGVAGIWGGMQLARFLGL